MSISPNFRDEKIEPHSGPHSTQLGGIQVVVQTMSFLPGCQCRGWLPGLWLFEAGGPRFQSLSEHRYWNIPAIPGTDLVPFLPVPLLQCTLVFFIIIRAPRFSEVRISEGTKIVHVKEMRPWCPVSSEAEPPWSLLAGGWPYDFGRVSWVSLGIGLCTYKRMSSKRISEVYISSNISQPLSTLSFSASCLLFFS